MKNKMKITIVKTEKNSIFRKMRKILFVSLYETTYSHMQNRDLDNLYFV